MAQVRLTLREADGRLPAVCMVCGAEATVTKSKKMSWTPPWVGVLILAGLLPYVIVASILTKRTTVKAPFCEAHQGHWFNRLMINLGTMFLCALIGAGGFFAIVALSGPGPNDFSAFGCFLPVAMLVIWIVVLVIIQQTAIRPEEITERDIVLKGVCQEFVNAMDDHEEERLASRRSRRGRDDDDDAPPPPKKRRPPADDDAFEE